MLRCSGSYAPEDMMRALDHLLAAPDFRAPALLVVDVSESASLLRRPSADLRRIVDYFLPRAAAFGGRCAVVAEGAFRYGMMRMATTWLQIDEVDARVFRSVSEAERWLARGSAADD